MKAVIEIVKSVDWALKNDQDTGLIDVLKAISSFSKEASVNKWDIIEQIDRAICQIEDYIPDRKELHLLNCFCEDFEL